MHLFKYELKILLRDRILVFWTMIFPLLLATFFNLAFSNLTSSENFKAIDLAVVQQQEKEDFKTVITSLSKDDENKLVNIQYTTKQKAQYLLEEEEISGYYIIDKDIEVVVNSSGINQTILKTIVDEYYQTTSTYTNIYQLNPQVFMSGVLEKVDLSKDNFQEQNENNLDLTVIYFYTLIGMTCLYAGFWGLKVTNKTEANLSRKGTRVAISPTNKWKTLLVGMLAGFIIHYFDMLVLMAYLVFALQIDFGSQVGYILLLMAVGSFVGLAIGNLVGNGLKCKEDTKITVISMSSLALSFFSGMMVIDLKYLIQENFPIVAFINPVNLITDALYALYYYTTTDRFFLNILCLLVIGAVISLISYLLSRGKQYDSI